MQHRGPGSSTVRRDWGSFYSIYTLSAKLSSTLLNIAYGPCASNITNNVKRKYLYSPSRIGFYRCIVNVPQFTSHNICLCIMIELEKHVKLNTQEMLTRCQAILKFKGKVLNLEVVL